MKIIYSFKCLVCDISLVVDAPSKSCYKCGINYYLNYKSEIIEAVLINISDYTIYKIIFNYVHKTTELAHGAYYITDLKINKLLPIKDGFTKNYNYFIKIMNLK